MRNQTLCFVFQSVGFIESDTLYSNVKLPLLFSDKYKGKEVKNRVLDIIKQVGLEGNENKKVKDMSGGQQQRVAIARAMVNDPDIILADEPTSALDSNTSDEIMKVLLDLQKKEKTIIVVTHDINVAKKMDKIVSIQDGIII